MYDYRTTHTVLRNGCKHAGRNKGWLFTLKSQAPFQYLITAIMLFHWTFNNVHRVCSTASRCPHSTAVSLRGWGARKREIWTCDNTPAPPFFASIISWGSAESVEGPTGKVSVVWWGVALSPSTWTLFSREGLVWNRFSCMNNLLVAREPPRCRIPWILLSRMSVMAIFHRLVICLHFVTSAEPTRRWISYTGHSPTDFLKTRQITLVSFFLLKKRRSQVFGLREGIIKKSISKLCPAQTV